MIKINNQTSNLTDKKIEQIASLFPQVVTEKEDESGNIVKAVDFDLLRQELSKEIVEGDDERYRLDWPGKKRSKLKANTPIKKTLRPIREESVNFDTTENLYIEGDNFEALKILQESYLGKVKMIYIDPPYNTGTAMIYKNDFSKSQEDYEEDLNLKDEEGGKLVRNTDSNGRFHSDWLSMMYSRLIISRDLLNKEGFLVIAIDHNELHNLIAISDEILGEENRLGIVSVVHKPEGRNQEKFFGTSNEFMLVYSKNIEFAKFNDVVLDENLAEKFNYSDDKGSFKLKNFIRMSDGKYSLRENKPSFYYPVYVDRNLKDIRLIKKEDYFEVYPITESGQERTWKTTPGTLLERFNKGEIVALKNEKDSRIELFEKLREKQVIKTHWIDKKYHGYHFGTKIIDSLLKNKTFDFPKSLFLMIDILKIMTRQDDIIMDFFSGSATTAHAIMQLNAEDKGNRKFIMIQIPEDTDSDSEARKAGYQTISDIGKERIRRAAKKIQEDFNEDLAKRNTPIDIGFRVYQVDSTNMSEVERHPSILSQESLLDFVDNIKTDRTPEDLLTEVMLNLGLTLDLPIERKEIDGKEIFLVQSNSLIACFDEEINEQVVNEMAQHKPLKVVFRDSSFKDDKDRINFENLFKSLTPETIVSVI